LFPSRPSFQAGTSVHGFVNLGPLVTGPKRVQIGYNLCISGIIDSYQQLPWPFSVQRQDTWYTRRATAFLTSNRIFTAGHEKSMLNSI